MFSKNENGVVFEGDFIPDGFVQMTSEAVALHLNPIPTPEQLAEQAKAEAHAYLARTDWVEPYLIKHYIGLELLPLDSNKFVIEQNRKEARELLK